MTDTKPYIFAKIRVVHVESPSYYEIGDVGVIMQINPDTYGASVRFLHKPALDFDPYLYRHEFELVDEDDAHEA